MCAVPQPVSTNPHIPKAVPWKHLFYNEALVWQQVAFSLHFPPHVNGAGAQT